jgi:hypothetical protein
MLRIQIGYGFNRVSLSGFGIRIRIQGQKRKNYKFLIFFFTELVKIDASNFCFWYALRIQHSQHCFQRTIYDILDTRMSLVFLTPSIPGTSFYFL